MMSVHTGEAEMICSLRVFRILTQGGQQIDIENKKGSAEGRPILVVV
jgi:hypothetical protein